MPWSNDLKSLNIVRRTEKGVKIALRSVNANRKSVATLEKGGGQFQDRQY